MLKACTNCGGLHPLGYICRKGKIYRGGRERGLRSSARWTDKSKEIRYASNYLCEVCRDHGAYNYDGLEVHHIIKVKDDPTKTYDNFNLICLCTPHHKAADKGLLKIDYLLKLAAAREKRHR